MQRTRKPGRPRDPKVIARDEHVYQLITQGVGARSELAAQTGHDREAIALSVRRLKRAGRIRACWDGTNAVWVVADGKPCG